MSNILNAYNDYTGPRLPGVKNPDKVAGEDGRTTPITPIIADETNPCLPFSWMEGDSLAPPCGSSISLIHHMLEFASVHQDDVLYDLGCGDGRVLLEALVRKKCCQGVGVEIEEPIVGRARELVRSIPESFGPERIQIVHDDLRNVLSALVQRVPKEEDTDNGHLVVLPDTNMQEKQVYQDLPMPTVLFLHLLPEGIAEIENDLVKLLPHMTIVCCSWGLKSIRPILEKDFYDRRSKTSTTLFLYTKECFERIKGFEYMLSVYQYGH